jgi:signal transduction histidine kinase
MTSNESPQQEVTVILSTLKSIAESVIHAAEAGDLRQVLQQIAYVAQQLVHSRYAALGIPGEQNILQYFEVVGLKEDEIKQIAHPPIGRGLLGVIMREREILRLEHIHNDPRSIGFPQHHPEMDRLLGVPVQAGQQLFGMLYLTDRLDDLPFTQQDQWLVETLAGYAALAIAETQLREQQRRLTLLEERERVGMELHDGVIQSLYAIGMHLQLLKMSSPSLTIDLTAAMRDIDTVIEDIRHYILNLKTASQEQKSVRQYLEEVIARLHVPESLAVRIMATDSPPPFAPPMMETICQIAHEAVSNIIRHAQATEALIAVQIEARQFQMTIQDNGRGFHPEVSSSYEGLGLHNMMRRTHINRGELTVDSAPDEGTRLIFRFPI